MQRKHLPLAIKESISKIDSRLKSLICFTSILPFLLMTSCGRKEIWFSCAETYKSNRGNQAEDFYIKILRINGGIEANYIDANNAVRANTKETPITFNVSANIYPSAFKRRIVQTSFLINKKTLEFSKQMSHFDPKKLFNTPEFTGGISIQNAGTCKKLKRKPKSMIL